MDANDGNRVRLSGASAGRRTPAREIDRRRLEAYGCRHRWRHPRHERLQPRRDAMRLWILAQALARVQPCFLG